MITRTIEMRTLRQIARHTLYDHQRNNDIREACIAISYAKQGIGKKNRDLINRISEERLSHIDKFEKLDAARSPKNLRAKYHFHKRMLKNKHKTQS